MNSEKLCPLCCQNMTRGTICTECSLTQPSLRWMEAGTEPLIRGVPASQAKCPHQDQPQVDDREQISILSSPSIAIEFACRTCGKTLQLLKHAEDASTDNTFCPACDRQYWIDWKAGVLHMGLDDDQLYSRMMNRLTSDLRKSGLGKVVR